jgi:hypothetical protein
MTRSNAGNNHRSSSREPTAVFMLLESLYGAYDKRAEKWGVYKVSLYNACEKESTQLGFY